MRYIRQKTIVYLAIVAAAILFWALDFGVQNRRIDNAYAALLEEASPAGSAPPPRSSGPLTPDAARVPILVYHNIHPPYPGEAEKIRKVTTPPELFEREMHYFQAAGYHVISFGILEQYLKVGGHLPPNPVILSFDDGWEDQFTYAFPVLRKYGFTATFFIVTNYVGRRDFLSWNQIRKLASAGMTIGSHSCTHPFLSRIVDHSVFESEISGSKRTIELHLGKPIEEFAYPYGAFNQSVIQLVEKAGYRSARADYFGMWHSKNDQYFLSAINAPPNLDAFKRACVGTWR